jgi:electron transfer flavoprotein alpha subunit
MSILIIAEINQGEIIDATYELLAYGKELASGLGVPSQTLVLGHNLNGKLGEMGATDELIIIDDVRLENFSSDVWVDVVAGVALARNSRLVLSVSSSRGIDFTSQVAGKLQASHIGYCQGITVADGTVTTTSLLYGGKLLISSQVMDKTVISFLPGSKQASEGKVSGTPPTTSETLDTYSALSKVKFKQLHLPDTSDVDIASQEILVSIGRGIQDEGNIELAKELAEIMGATVSASRPIIDQGWLPKTRQVGKSGKLVKPKLYMALGISGAPEHAEGMRSAELILAVNTDEAAPIFDIAHYGVNADILDFIPELTEVLSER